MCTRKCWQQNWFFTLSVKLILITLQVYGSTSWLKFVQENSSQWHKNDNAFKFFGGWLLLIGFWGSVLFNTIYTLAFITAICNGNIVNGTWQKNSIKFFKAIKSFIPWIFSPTACCCLIGSLFFIGTALFSISSNLAAANEFWIQAFALGTCISGAFLLMLFNYLLFYSIDYFLLGKVYVDTIELPLSTI
jgi:hypothetical protein